MPALRRRGHLCDLGTGIASRLLVRALSQEIHDMGSEVVDCGYPKCVDAGRLIFFGGSQYKVRPYGTQGMIPVYTTRRGSKSCTGEYNTNWMLAVELKLQFEAQIHRAGLRTRVARVKYSTWAAIRGLALLVAVAGTQRSHCHSSVSWTSQSQFNLVGNIVIVDIDFEEI